MPYSVGFGNQERQILSNDRLPPDVRVALVQFKNQIKTGARLEPFENQEGALPPPAAGQAYYEYQVGQAHPEDPRPRGKRRLVALVDAGRNVLRMYFTDAHYTLGSWVQLQYP
jgi:guanyl-specific ribonuclease Sa